MRILVTGGAGFIASHIVDAYINEGHRVCVIDNLSTGKESNINKQSDFYQLDVRSKQIEDVFRNFKPEIVNHHAAQIDVRKSVEDPITDADINVLGTVNLLQLSVKYNVNKFIFASTGGAIYGEQINFPADEEHPTNPVSPYGVSKLCAEKYINYFHLQHGLPYLILRYSNVYGPRQNPHGEAGVVAIFVNKLIHGETPVINGDGLQTRDFVYVKDVVEANLIAIKTKFSGILNIGTGIETDILTIYRFIIDALKIKKEPVFGAPKPGEQRRSSITGRKAKEEMGWEPVYTLERGLKETVEYFKSNLKK